MSTASDVIAGTATWSVEQGDCLAALAALPERYVDLVCFSPPYEEARLYLEDGKNLGVARKTDEWVAWMVEVIGACVRVCKGLVVCVCEGRTKEYRYSCGPFLLMADLCRAGFNLRKPAVYRRIGIPGSGGPDWLRNDWEPIICVTPPGRLPFSDSTACGHEPVYPPGGKMSHRLPNGERVDGGKTRRDKRVGDRARTGEEMQGYKPPDLANPGNVLDCRVGGGMMGGDAFSAQNEAPFPEDLAAFFVRSFCPEGGVCLDPFSGSGTTSAVAVRWNRRAIGFDLRESQVQLSHRRIEGETPLALFAEDTP